MPTTRTRRGGLVAIGLVLLPLVSGCDEKAREFARQTAVILQQRSEQLSKKIAAEASAYAATATIASEAQRAVADSSLTNERIGRSIALAADYDEGRRPVSRWQSDIAEYASIDHALARDSLGAELDAGSQFLEKIHALEVERDRADALAKLLAALATKPSLARDIDAVTAFAEDTRTEFDDKVCDALGKDTSAAGQAAFKARACKKK